MIDEARLNGLYRYGLSLTNDESLSYDLLQDALESYLRLSEERRPDQGQCAERYLRTCMRNRYIDQLRRSRRYPSEPLDEGEENLVSLNMPAPETLLIERQMLEVILSRLDPLERELLHFWAYEEMTAREIADQLDLPRGTILSRIHRLRRKIERFDLHGDDTAGGADR